MARVGFNLNLVFGIQKDTQVTNRFRIVTVLSSPSYGPRIARLSRINPSLSRDSIHANCIESPVIMESSPCTNPHNSRQHTIAGVHVPMTKTTVADHSLPLFLPIVRRFTCPVQRRQEFSDQVFALHLFFRRQLNRHLTGRFSLTSALEASKNKIFRVVAPGFHITGIVGSQRLSSFPQRPPISLG